MCNILFPLFSFFYFSYLFLLQFLIAITIYYMFNFIIFASFLFGWSVLFFSFPSFAILYILKSSFYVLSEKYE